MTNHFSTATETLVFWGKNDPFLLSKKSKKSQKDLQNIEVHLRSSGHFAIEEYNEEIAG